MKLHEIGLLTKDPKVSKQFYHNIRGLEVDHEEDGLSVFNSGWPGLEIECSEYSDCVHRSFSVDDVDKLAEDLREKGVKFVGPVSVGKQVFVAKHGGRYGLQMFRSPAAYLDSS